MTATPATTTGAPGRTPTPLDAVCEDHVTRYTALDPIAATFIGLREHADRLTDLSPQGHAERAALARDTLARARAAGAADAVDAVTLDALTERLGLELALHEAGEDERSLDVAASPVQSVRDVFDMTPAATPDEIEAVAARLAAVPAALDGYLGRCAGRSGRAGRPPVGRP